MQTSEAEQAFLQLLNNEPQDAKPRDRGFVVLIEERRSLASLQEACFRQTYNHCYTARYRLNGRPVFGSLAVSILGDMKSVLDGDGSRGIFRPRLTELKDQHIIAKFGQRTPWGERAIRAEDLLSLCQEIADLTQRSIGARFVLFCEFADENLDEDEWRLAGESLLHRLPERAGIVFSGVPDHITGIVEETGRLAAHTPRSEASVKA